MTCCFVCVFTMVVICLVCWDVLAVLGGVVSSRILSLWLMRRLNVAVGRYAVGIGNEHEGVCH